MIVPVKSPVWPFAALGSFLLLVAGVAAWVVGR